MRVVLGLDDERLSGFSGPGGEDYMGTEVSSAQAGSGLGEIIKINEGEVQKHLGEVVRDTVEETLRKKGA